MAVPPDFTAGSVLTAAQMNQVGWWTVKPTSVTGGTITGNKVVVGSAVSSVVLTGVFSSDYDAYRIIVAGGAGSATASLRLTLGSTATGYYYGGKARSYAGADLNIEGANAAFWYAAETAANGMSGIIDLINPNKADRTLFYTALSAPRTDGYSIFASGFLNDATAYTACTFTFNGGTQTGGNIYIYGYNNG